MVRQKQGELVVVTKAKDLCSYIITITQKSPKQFRFTFVSRMQNLSLDIIESIYRANDVYLLDKEREQKMLTRLEFQHKALTNCRLLSYFSLLALEQGCIMRRKVALEKDCLWVTKVANGLRCFI